MAILPSVFVSYSREDSNSIQYAVGVLEAGGAEVFRDLDDIRFGERWEEVITKKIEECERVLVFWSKAAQQSEWVGREYKMGLQLEKTLVPILLDNTPLPSDLGAFHALTLANFMPKASRWKRYGGWVVGGVATTALAGVLGFQLLETNEPLMAPPASQSSELAIEQRTESEVVNRQATRADSVAAEEMTVESPPLIERTQQSVNPSAESGGDDGVVTFNYQYDPAPKPAAPMSAPVTKPASDDIEGTSSAVKPSTEMAVEVDNAPNAESTEGFELPPYLLWIVGILVLLSLCWAALRRYSHKTQRSNEERFVEMVFDNHELRH